jgi:hypothetical protein
MTRACCKYPADAFIIVDYHNIDLIHLFIPFRYAAPKAGARR